MKKKRLSKRCYNTDHSWHYETTWDVGGRVVRVHIRRNAYDFQSYQHLDLFDGEKWNQMVHKPIDSSFSIISYVHNRLNEQQERVFENAENSLLNEIIVILSHHAKGAAAVKGE